MHELIEELRAVDPEAEVRLAYQENYPIQDHVRTVDSFQPEGSSRFGRNLSEEDGRYRLLPSVFTREDGTARRPERITQIFAALVTG